ITPYLAQLTFIAEEIRQSPEQTFEELCSRQRLSVGTPERGRHHALELPLFPVGQPDPDLRRKWLYRFALHGRRRIRWIIQQIAGTSFRLHRIAIPLWITEVQIGL